MFGKGLILQVNKIDDIEMWGGGAFTKNGHTYSRTQGVEPTEKMMPRYVYLVGAQKGQGPKNLRILTRPPAILHSSYS